MTTRLGGIAVALTLAFASAAQAAVIVDVQFNGTPGLGNNHSGDAVVGEDGDFWNNLGASGTGVALNNPANAASGLALTWNSGGAFTTWSISYANGFHSTDYGKLMDGYLFQSNPAGSLITLSGLSPSTGFTLYLYSEGESGSSGRRLSINANGVTATTTPANYTVGTFIENQNYLRLNVNSDSSGILNIAYSGAVGEANVNGFQLTSVPEPASMTIVVASALIGLALWRRSRTRPGVSQ